jgi:outer membrane protein assembly factor BamB
MMDAEGAVFLGTGDGQLWRLSADGETTTGRFFNPIFAPVAIAQDGSVFFIIQVNLPSGERLPFRSVLVKANADLDADWTVDLPEGFVATGAPKVWDRPDGPHAFVHVTDSGFASELLVFDSTGQERDRSGLLRCSRPIVGENPMSDFLSGLWDLLWLDAPPPGDEFGGWPFPSPTPAVVDSPGLVEDGHVIVVVVDDVCRFDAFDYDGRQLTKLWERGHELDERQSSPAVIAAGLLVIGNASGVVLGLDVLTGDELWRYDADEPVWATAASFVRPIFVVSTHHIHAIDLNGTRMSRRELQGVSRASPAVSGDRVHVATSEDLASYELRALGDDVHDTAYSGGLLTPAIGPDGSIIAVHDHREVWSYPPPA